MDAESLAQNLPQECKQRWLLPITITGNPVVNVFIDLNKQSEAHQAWVELAALVRDGNIEIVKVGLSDKCGDCPNRLPDGICLCFQKVILPLSQTN